jgi:uncharacterized protein (DUF433 family)
MSAPHPTDIWYQDEPTSPHEAKVPGSGLGVWEVVRDIIGMGSVDAVLKAFPHLSREAIQAALHYYADHSAEIDRRVQENASVFAKYRGRLSQLAGKDVDAILDNLREPGLDPGPPSEEFPHRPAQGELQDREPLDDEIT